jgi:preprotein translocase subunit YajC
VLWPYLVILVVLAGLLFLSVRNRKRAMSEQLVRASRIEVGTEVMTTSGLYGTVVAKHEDGTVVLSIAPGVEVKWAAAALRDAASLSADYRRGLPPGSAGSEPPPADLHKSDDGS